MSQLDLEIFFYEDERKKPMRKRKIVLPANYLRLESSLERLQVS